MDRLRKTKYLKLSYIDNVDSTKLKIVYHNLRSLNKNISHILTDKWYYQFEVLILSETQTISTDEFTIKDYELIFRSDNNLIERKQKGVMSFFKKISNIVSSSMFASMKIEHKVILI